MADSPYAAYHRLQDEAIRDAPPYPADRFNGRGIVMAAGGPRHFTNAWVTLNILVGHLPPASPFWWPLTRNERMATSASSDPLVPCQP